MQWLQGNGQTQRNEAPGALDPGVLQRYRRLTLWAAGIISMVPIVVCLMTLVLFVGDFVHEQYSEFSGQAAGMQLAFARRELWVRISAIYEQTVAPRLAPNRVLLDQLIGQKGTLTIRHPENPIQMEVWAAPDEPDGYARYAWYLALADDYAYRGGAYLQWLGERLSFTSYMFSPDRKFIVIIRSPREAAERPVTSYAQAYAKLRGVIPDVSPGDPAHTENLTDGNIHWLAPNPDRLTGDSSSTVVQAALLGNRPFLILGSTLPLKELESIIGEERFGEVAGLVLPGSTVLFGTPGPTEATRTIPPVMRKIPPLDSRESKPDSRFINGHVLLRAYLVGPGWTFIRYFSFATMASELSSGVWLNILAAFVVVVLVWTMWFWLERKVFAPGRRQSHLIYESEQLNRAVVENSPAGIALIDPASREVFLQNEAAAEYMQRADAARLPLMEFAVSGYARSTQREINGKPQSLAISIPEESRALDLQMTLVPSRYRGSEAILCTFIDITAQKEVERELKNARDLADAANRAKSAFFAATSHEIRTPLNVILGNLELLNRMQMSELQTQRLQAVTSATSLLLGIINDILDFTKMETNRLVLEAIPFDLAGIAEQTSAAFTPIAHSKGLRFEKSIDSSLAGRYIGDPTRIRQIMFNLISNAIKFTEQGEVALEVYLTGDEPDSPVGIAVTDTGPGICREHQATLFRPFTQTDPSISRRYGGTGLGLAICERLVQLMHGTITLESEPGVGSAFTIELPLRVVSSQEKNGPEALSGTTKETSSTDALKLRFLVVDDTAANRELVKLQLLELGQDVETAENGVDALQRFAVHHFDLILTDVSMPVMDGPDMARHMRAQGVKVPIIAITAHVDPEVHERCRASGIDVVLVRPLLIDELDRTIRELIGAGANDGPVLSSGFDFARGELPEPVVRKLRETFVLLAAEIRRGAVQRRRDEILQYLHSVKGGFAMIHESAFVERCNELEHLARGEAFDTLLEALGEWEHLGRETLALRSGEGGDD
ncbi:ATP-binding protein [Paraburkholderia sp. J12]|uniref:hybrid sensor histidine kinase/response regulator n=1 Tax=Paraburkholderia sp. J12 TaxID=2805432 RepID=UPI002ABD8159|nr:ATP-binding protein [Paraburkholderia sp. J12]